MFVVNALATLMRLFISRERESRADAEAVRLTRDPVSLAEALYIIAFGRRRLLSSADFLETLFIVNPNLSSLDEETGLFSDLFSTHPPVGERIKILCAMAHTDESQLQSALKASQQTEQEAQERALIAQGEVNRWFVTNPSGELIGPIPMERIVGLDWAKGESMAKKIGHSQMVPLSQIPEFVKLKAKNSDGRDMYNVCPGCGEDLQSVKYERISVLQCASCEGILADEESVGMILYRKEATFSNEVQQKAATLLDERIPYSRSHIIGDSDRTHHCRKTIANRRRLKKMFFNRLYMVEVDRCLDCGLIWFDKDELELLQCIYEMRQQAVLAPRR
jgi:Zn-finger nucleic acid-binding protein